MNSNFKFETFLRFQNDIFFFNRRVIRVSSGNLPTLLNGKVRLLKFLSAVFLRIGGVN